MPPRGPGKVSPAQRVLAEWRGIDLAPLQKAQAPSARPAADVLSRVLADVRIDRRRGDAEIVKVWNHLLEPDITAHAQPTALRKGTLFVSVDSSPWLCELVRNRRKDILTRLQGSFGRDSITRISFRVG